MLKRLLRPAAVAAGLGFITSQVWHSLTFWAVYWLIWFFGLFLVPELYWVFRGSANTVSDNTWRFESLDRSHPFNFSEWTPVHWAFAVVFVLFMTWLFFHLVFGQFRG